MKKVTTKNAATTDKGTAKIQRKPHLLNFQVGKLPCSTIFLATETATDPDPLDWGELDSLMSKPPQRERKPKKAAYKKPEAVKRLEQVTHNKHRDDTANGCTRCIIDYLHYKGWQAERINTMGIPHDTRQQATDILGRTRTIGSVEWRPSGSTVGSADISATIKGRSVKIEVKIGKDRQSAAQKAYQREVEAAGGLYFIAHDFTSFVKWYSTIMKGGSAR